VVHHSDRVLVVLGGITAPRFRVDDSICRLLLRGTLGCLVSSLLPALVTCSAIIIDMVSGSILLVFDSLLLVSIDL
jgi:hypothetical protein